MISVSSQTGHSKVHLMMQLLRPGWLRARNIVIAHLGHRGRCAKESRVIWALVFLPAIGRVLTKGGSDMACSLGS
jgi:hypothetical protein